MADGDVDYAKRMHPDDRQAIIEAMRAGQERERAPDKPPAYATGADAKIFKAAAERVADERGYLPPDAIRALVRDEISDFYDERVRQLVDKAQKFLPDEEIENRIKSKLEEAFSLIGLPIDKERREATGQSVRSIMKWQGRIDKVLGGMALAVLGAVFYAVLRLVGVNIPVSPGGGH